MRVYLGIFLVALSTLALEITLTRFLSVITWYHLAFFAIATAILGMTAGATTVYLKANWFEPDQLRNRIAEACLGYALIVPFSLIILSLLPLRVPTTVVGFAYLLLTTLVVSVPFYFAGIAITATLTKWNLPIGKLYAADLIGASAGCLLVLAGLEVLDAPSLVLLCAAIGAMAAFSFADFKTSPRLLRLSWGILAVLILATFTNAYLIRTAAPVGIRPLVAKQRIQDPADNLLERWNSFSQVVVYNLSYDEPQYWGASPLAPQTEIPQHLMRIDGEAATTVQPFQDLADIDHLRYDVTNVAYHLRPTGGAAVIGVGGGRDIQSAILFGHEDVTGIDVNPIFVDLLENEFRDFAGIADQPGVTLVVDEARSYLSAQDDKYRLIQMSLIDTWASTGAGAFSLSENSLYTVEAWQIFLGRLEDDGIFTVSRWHNPAHLGESGRIVSLAMAALFQLGVEEPARHIAMVTSTHLSTLIVSKQPLTDQEIKILEQVSGDLQFNVVIAPNQLPNNEVLQDIISAPSLTALETAIADKPLNYTPSTDENPYFFNMLRLQHLDNVFLLGAGISFGNLVATLTLLGLIGSLLILTLVTVVAPLYLKTRSEQIPKPAKIFWLGALYFSLIGAGFMFVEIALIQKLSVFLSHPVYALGILLFTIIASTGVGSFLSAYLPLTRLRWVLVFPIAVVIALIIVRFLISLVLASFITAPLLNKVLLSILVIFPLGILLGFFFPTGMRLFQSINMTHTPWYWALNGIFSVLSSALAVFVSLYFGISTNFYIAAACYIALLFSLYHLHKASQVSAGESVS